MRKWLGLVGIATLLIGIVSMGLSLDNPTAEKSSFSNNATFKYSFAKIVDVENGGAVNAYVLAIIAPTNGSSIVVVSNPGGKRYTFVRRGNLYYPERPTYIENIYVENLPGSGVLGVYSVSESYAHFLEVREGKFAIRYFPGFGGLIFICDNDGFLLNVSEPRGTVYSDDESVIMRLTEDSFIIGNKSHVGKPSLLVLSCDGGNIGYLVRLNVSRGAVEDYVGFIPLHQSVALFPGFNFTNLEVIHSYSAYLTLKGEQPGKGKPVWESKLPAVLAIIGGVVALALSLRKWGW